MHLNRTTRRQTPKAEPGEATSLKSAGSMRLSYRLPGLVTFVAIPSR